MAENHAEIFRRFPKPAEQIKLRLKYLKNKFSKSNNETETIAQVDSEQQKIRFTKGWEKGKVFSHTGWERVETVPIVSPNNRFEISFVCQLTSGDEGMQIEIAPTIKNLENNLNITLKQSDIRIKIRIGDLQHLERRQALISLEIEGQEYEIFFKFKFAVNGEKTLINSVGAQFFEQSISAGSLNSYIASRLISVENLKQGKTLAEFLEEALQLPVESDYPEVNQITPQQFLDNLLYQELKIENPALLNPFEKILIGLKIAEDSIFSLAFKHNALKVKSSKELKLKQLRRTYQDYIRIRSKFPQESQNWQEISNLISDIGKEIKDTNNFKPDETVKKNLVETEVELRHVGNLRLRLYKILEIWILQQILILNKWHNKTLQNIPKLNKQKLRELNKLYELFQSDDFHQLGQDFKTLWNFTDLNSGKNINPDEISLLTEEPQISKCLRTIITFFLELINGLTYLESCKAIAVIDSKFIEPDLISQPEMDEDVGPVFEQYVKLRLYGKSTSIFKQMCRTNFLALIENEEFFDPDIKIQSPTISLNSFKHLKALMQRAQIPPLDDQKYTFPEKITALQSHQGVEFSLSTIHTPAGIKSEDGSISFIPKFVDPIEFPGVYALCQDLYKMGISETAIVNVSLGLESHNFN
ncbi:MAG: hypothetical protein OHK0017_00680 [Patescibacteria group bacterium]